MRRSSITSWWAVTLALFLVACQGRRFEPAHSVSKLRVLGIQATPPEVRPNGSAQLTALAVRPDGGPVSYRWQWCPFATSGNDYFECPITQEELEQQVADALPDGVSPNLFQLPDFELGTDPTATLRYPLTRDLLLGLCEAIAQATTEAAQDNELLAAIPQLGCTEGYEVSVRVIITASDEPASDEMLANLRDQDQSQVVVASKKVTLWLDSENEQDINPIVDAIEIRPAHREDRELQLAAGHDWVETIEDYGDDWYRIDPNDPPQILVGTRYVIRSLVDPDSIQVWSKLTPENADTDDRYEPAEREVLAFRWFTTAGGIADANGLFVDGRNSLDEASVTEFLIPPTNELQLGGADGERFIESCPEVEDGDPETGCEVQLFSVVRDDRRGQGWLGVTVIANEVTRDGFRVDRFGEDEGEQ